MNPINPLRILKNLAFHAMIEKEVQQLKFGKITFNVVLKDGEVILKTMNLTRSRQIKYPLKNTIDKIKP